MAPICGEGAIREDVKWRAAVEVVVRNQAVLRDVVQRTFLPLLRRFCSSREGGEEEGGVDVEVCFVALCAVAPGLVIGVMAKLEGDLRSSDPIVRRARVELLWRVFLEGGATSAATAVVGGQYATTFRALLGRFVDADANIRSLCCSMGAKLLQASRKRRDGAGALSIVQHLKGRILDPDERVRAEAVSAIFTAIENEKVDFNDSEDDRDGGLDEDVVKASVQRIMDRKPSVRKHTLSQLRAFVHRQWSHERHRPAEERHLRWIVEDLCSLLRTSNRLSSSANGTANHDDDLVYQIGSIVTELIFSRNSASTTSTSGARQRADPNDDLHPTSTTADHVKQRVKSSLFVLCLVRKRDLETISALFATRARFRREVVKLIDVKKVRQFSTNFHPNTRAKKSAACFWQFTPCMYVRSHFTFAGAYVRVPVCMYVCTSICSVNYTEQRNSGGGDLRASIQSLASLLPTSLGKKDKLLMDLCSLIDGHIFRRIADVMDASKTALEVDAAVDDALKRIGSKTPLADLLRRYIFPLGRLEIFSAEHIRSMVSIIIEEDDEGGESDVKASARWLLRTAAEIYPDSVGSIVHDVVPLLQRGGKNEGDRDVALSVLASGPHVANITAEEAAQMSAVTSRLCQEGTNVKRARLAAAAWATITATVTATNNDEEAEKLENGIRAKLGKKRTQEKEEFLDKTSLLFFSPLTLPNSGECHRALPSVLFRAFADDFDLENLAAVFATVHHFCTVRPSLAEKIANNCVDVAQQLLHGEFLSEEDEDDVFAIATSAIKAVTAIFTKVLQQGAWSCGRENRSQKLYSFQPSTMAFFHRYFYHVL